jgi:Mrp family chromosome partitioning ATPase
MAKEVNHTVLLVDMDLKKPSLHKYFYYEPELGLSDYLLGDVDLSDVIINPGISRFVFLPSKDSIDDSSELLTAPKMVNLSIELKKRYAERVIIYDLPPLLSCDDTIAFLPNVDAVLLVIEEGRSTRNEVQKAIDILQDTPLLGTVLNKTQEKVDAY